MDAITLTLNPRDRVTLSTTIEALINMLDAIDPDPDLEDGGDAEGVNEDGGDIIDERHDDDELEPFLGWPERGNQGHDAWLANRRWVTSVDDAEDGREMYAQPTGRPDRCLSIDPALLPDRFIVRLDGKCMEPEIADGARAEVDKTLPVADGDLVYIVLDPAQVARGYHTTRVKRLVRRHPSGLHIFEMLNPPTTFFWPMSHVLAVYKIARILDEREPRGPMLSEGDMLAARARGMALA